MKTFLLRLEYRVEFYFFFLAPLFLAVAAFCCVRIQYRFSWVVLVLLIFALGINFFPAFQLHYLGALTCLFVLISVVGLQQIARWSPEASSLILLLCFVHGIFWYGMHLFEDDEVAPAMIQYETWDSINHRNPERRIFVNQQLAEIPGRLLVFVRYSPRHIFQDEWVYNEASLDSARRVWARDFGPQENESLRVLSDRQSLLLEPDTKTSSAIEFLRAREVKPKRELNTLRSFTASLSEAGGWTSGISTCAERSVERQVIAVIQSVKAFHKHFHLYPLRDLECPAYPHANAEVVVADPYIPADIVPIHNRPSGCTESVTPEVILNGRDE